MTSDLVQNKSKTLALPYSALLLTKYQDLIKSLSLSQTKNKKIGSVQHFFYFMSSLACYRFLCLRIYLLIWKMLYSKVTYTLLQQAWSLFPNLIHYYIKHLINFSEKNNVLLSLCTFCLNNFIY